MRRMLSPFYTQLGGGGGVPHKVACVPECSRGEENTVESCVQPFHQHLHAPPQFFCHPVLGPLEARAFRTSLRPSARGLCQVRQIRLFPSQTHPPWSLRRSCCTRSYVCMSSSWGRLSSRHFPRSTTPCLGKWGTVVYLGTGGAPPAP